jgi:acetyl esterase/lipase
MMGSMLGLSGRFPLQSMFRALYQNLLVIATFGALTSSYVDAQAPTASPQKPAATTPAQAAKPAASPAPASKTTPPLAKVDAGLSGKTVLLWPQGAPKAVGKTPADVPTLTVYLPAHNTTQTGVLIAPGGGYTNLSLHHEGEDIAHWLNAHGVAGFVLKYRLGPVYHHPIELNDAQRALRLIRLNAKDYGVAADHIGMWGFSAGGHLAATAGTHFDAGNSQSADAVEKQSCRPDFLILSYPVITLLIPNTHGVSRKFLLGDDPTQELLLNLSDEAQVNKDTPPTFLFSTTDDGVVPVMNSVAFYTALVKAGIPAEMHLFQHGNHGSGLAEGNPQLSIWPELLIKWMRERGLASTTDAAATPNAPVAPTAAAR